ncbi:MAG: TonB family protein, partial [Terriglobia bacterium]
VIANPSVKAEAVSASEIKSVFLGERNSLRDGTHVEPVLSKGGPAHDTFLKDYLATNDDALQNYYRTLVFTGKGLMPKALRSDAEVVAYVARTRGAIGYVSSTVTLDGVRTLAVNRAENEGARKLIFRVEPVYPAILQSKHISGTVRLKVTIAPNGTVEHVELLGGNPILGDAAIAAVKKWVYAAGRSRTQTEVSIPFDAGS